MPRHAGHVNLVLSSSARNPKVLSSYLRNLTENVKYKVAVNTKIYPTYTLQMRQLQPGKSGRTAVHNYTLYSCKVIKVQWTWRDIAAPTLCCNARQKASKPSSTTLSIHKSKSQWKAIVGFEGVEGQISKRASVTASGSHLQKDTVTLCWKPVLH